MQNQTISVLYQDESFDVDYFKLHNSSNKFREMIQPYLDNGVGLQNLQLRILYNKFTTRNVCNFLKMIQNQKNNVHSHEIAEICELAKLFQAEKLYDKSLTYVRNQIDPNFTVSNDFNESNGQQYLEVEFITDLCSQHSYSTNDITYTPTETQMSPISAVNLSKSQNDIPLTPPPQQTTQPQPQPQQQQLYCVVYKIQVLSQLMKCNRYFFSLNEKILFTAKKKSNEIYIGQGNNIHINSNENESCARIMQCNGYNTVYTSNQEFKVSYIPFGVRKQFSLETSFSNDGKTLNWSPKEIDQNLYGQYNRIPVPSKKNMLLKNQAGSPTFIVRKMQDEVFEVECLSIVNPLIAFTLGLSQIIGPFIK